MHISTTDTFFIDAPILKLICWICRRDSNSELGWIGVRCGECGSVWSTDMGLSHIAYLKREFLGISRTDFCKQFGITRKTIRNYESDIPSRIHLERLDELIEQQTSEV